MYKTGTIYIITNKKDGKGHGKQNLLSSITPNGTTFQKIGMKGMKNKIPAYAGMTEKLN